MEIAVVQAVVVKAQQDQQVAQAQQVKVSLVRLESVLQVVAVVVQKKQATQMELDKAETAHKQALVA
jgi:hypothetical protein